MEWCQPSARGRRGWGGGGGASLPPKVEGAEGAPLPQDECASCAGAVVAGAAPVWLAPSFATSHLPRSPVPQWHGDSTRVAGAAMLEGGVSLSGEKKRSFSE